MIPKILKNPEISGRIFENPGGNPSPYRAAAAGCYYIQIQLFQNLKESQRIPKNPKESQIIFKNLKESQRIPWKILGHVQRIAKNPKESQRIPKNPMENLRTYPKNRKESQKSQRILKNPKESRIILENLGGYLSY